MCVVKYYNIVLYHTDFINIIKTYFSFAIKSNFTLIYYFIEY